MRISPHPIAVLISFFTICTILEVPRKQTELLIEALCEIGWRCESDLVAHLADPHFRVLHEQGGIFQAAHLDVVVWRHIEYATQLSVQAGSAHAHFLCKIVDAKLAVAHVLSDHIL